MRMSLYWRLCHSIVCISMNIIHINVWCFLAPAFEADIFPLIFSSDIWIPPWPGCHTGCSGGPLFRARLVHPDLSARVPPVGRGPISLALWSLSCVALTKSQSFWSLAVCWSKTEGLMQPGGCPGRSIGGRLTRMRMAPRCLPLMLLGFPSRYIFSNEFYSLIRCVMQAL